MMTTAFPKALPERDDAYKARVRALPCMLRYSGACQGTTEAHHAAIVGKGMSLKGWDRGCVPLCRWHHRSWHDANGYFLGMKREERRDWAVTAIRQTQAALDANVEAEMVPW